MHPESVSPGQEDGAEHGSVPEQSGESSGDCRNGEGVLISNAEIKPKEKLTDPSSEKWYQSEQKQSGDQNSKTHSPNQKANEKDNCHRMTKSFLRKLCKDQKLYITPALNDTLYLHFKGFDCIENLEEYTGLRCLWLECNGIQKIENLQAQTELRCLYLQLNLIHKIENLEALKKLDSLNLSNNFIKTIENLSCLPVLNTLQIANNHLETVEDIQHLKDCMSICVLDLSNNKLSDPDILSVLEAMPDLRVLNLMGNMVIKKILHYRRTVIVRLKVLTYLDDRPVFPKERACAEAWVKGGSEAEKEERGKWETKERKKIEESIEALATIRRRAMEKKKRKEMEEKGEVALSDSNVGEDPSMAGGPQSPATDGVQQKIEKFVRESFEALDEAFPGDPQVRAQAPGETKGEGDSQEDGPGPDAEAKEPKQPEPRAAQDGDRQPRGGHEHQPELGLTPKSILKAPTAEKAELNGSEKLETIDLEAKDKLYIDDLPDLEDIEINDILSENSDENKTSFPKIEIISEANDDSDPELEEGCTIQDKTSQDSLCNIFKISKDTSKKTITPLTEIFETESNRDSETKSDHPKLSKPLIQEICPNPVEMSLMSPGCSGENQPSLLSVSGKDPSASASLSGSNTSENKVQLLTDTEDFIVHGMKEGNEDIEFGLD
ncbi:dynein axonemal assembly factor 1 [Antechinus flavipes]|uniref:dynein axonemal assembly factor 1 n=1 Tax=Antechinus flavipes TaxID=38775 RepID=UPI002235B5BE|nr:dynein axonemal assembly factor 1 [Antechinus flavipes]XP_051830893.1 dynein axonemal assembly factor 1 [Antechinus flavipes]